MISKGAALLRVINKSTSIQNVRHMSGGQFVYRAGAAPHSKQVLYTAEIAGGLMWWWILWHLWHEPDHITGEFEYPNPRKWTDEELGIPPQ